METNIIRMAVESAIAATAAKAADTNKWNSLVTICGMVIGFLTLLVPILASYFKAKAAESKAALAVHNTEEAKRLTIGMAGTVEEVRKDVNSGATAMREKLAQATEKILELSKAMSALNEKQRGHEIEAAKVAAVAAASIPHAVPRYTTDQDSTAVGKAKKPVGDVLQQTIESSIETVAAAKHTAAAAAAAAAIEKPKDIV